MPGPSDDINMQQSVFPIFPFMQFGKKRSPKNIDVKFIFKAGCEGTECASKEQAHWTVEDETVLLNFLILVKSASGDGTNFKKATWKEAALKVNVNCSRGAEKTPDSCRSKYCVLKSMYKVVQAIHRNSGWSWDDEDSARITPEIQGTWNDYIERHPAAAPFCNARWAHLAAFDSLGASSLAN
ncbi:hypothetical protein CVT25_008097 [Psilocybe cyanescens]|uniref:Myb/SANT-like domain-containing protein n=1 Tax=Psilocybe cyanescens TaxID=93625 RepID=A0A409X6L9_PSICY|nr:hypothetical protein CVT25_008097 [Psilocybe cyanescens]